MFFAESSRKSIQDRVEAVSTNDAIADEDIQALGEDLARELGRLMETKLRVNSVKTRLENLQ
ncbi:MAG: hypothetical protein U7127_14210 [Phormidium sp.]